MIEMLKLSDEVNKAFIRESAGCLDEEKVKEIANKRPNANPFHYLIFRERARSIGYDDCKIDEMYESVANKILTSSSPIQKFFEESVIIYNLQVVKYACRGLIHDYQSIIRNREY